jgi:hypothetical protein
LAKVEHLTVPDVSWKLFESLRKLSGWLVTLGGLKSIFERAARLQKLAIPDPAPVSALSRRVAEVARLGALLDRLVAEIEHDEQQSKIVAKEVSSVLAEFGSLGVCPTCHQDISPEHVVVCAAG